jgi:hypothetical protein
VLSLLPSPLLLSSTLTGLEERLRPLVPLELARFGPTATASLLVLSAPALRFALTRSLPVCVLAPALGVLLPPRNARQPLPRRRTKSLSFSLSSSSSKPNPVLFEDEADLPPRMRQLPWLPLALPLLAAAEASVVEEAVPPPLRAR